jgi:integrase
MSASRPLNTDKKGLGQIVQGTLRWLVAQYYRSTEFMRLNEETRKVKRRILDQLCERAQNRQIATLEPRHVAAWRDEKKDTPESANSRVKVLRALFGWACQPEIALASHNPAREVKTLKSKNPGGHKTWTEALAKQFELAFPLGTKARLAFDLLVFTGARISDLHKFGPQMERDGKLCFTETKGFGVVDAEKKHELPILPALRASIDAYYAAHPGERHLCYLMTEFGAPYSLKGLGNWFASQCRLAKIPLGFSAHGLRKLAAVRCVRAGATEAQMMALFGWTTSKQIAVYIKEYNRLVAENEAAPLLMGERPTLATPAVQTGNGA